jgi:uncharacterized membrane protein
MPAFPALLDSERTRQEQLPNMILKPLQRERHAMQIHQIIAIILIILGVLGLAWGGFSYTRETHEASIGSLTLSVEERKRVNIPVWGGAGAIVIGGLLLAFGPRGRRSG